MNAIKAIIGCIIIASALMISGSGGVFKEQFDNTYKTVNIGNQVWMVENLNVSQFRNGESIPEARTDEEWILAGIDGKPVWCYYGNDPKNGEKYGKLYNWYAVNDPRGLAPEGWRIATDEDWTELTDFLGGVNVAGTQIKSTSGWYQDGHGTNKSGFSGHPGGARLSSGSFDYLESIGYWWSSTLNIDGYAWFRSLSDASGNVYRHYYNTRLGFSVRCLKE